MKLPITYYQQTDTLFLAKDLLGKVLCTRFNNVITKGIIVETEAYCGAIDKACHAYNHKRTKRTETMFKAGGVAYVYLCYGIHHLFNVVVNEIDAPHAILIRAIEPTEGIEEMMRRRGLNKPEYRLTSGPGTLAKAMGITTAINGTSLQSKRVWIEEGKPIKKADITASPRIGINYAEEYVNKTWRFYIANSKWVSKPR